MALPLTLIVITGEIDLSIASMLGLAGVVMGSCSCTAGRSGWRWPRRSRRRRRAARSTASSSPGLGLPSLAVTIGTLTLYRGIAQGILPTRHDRRVFQAAFSNIGVLPIPGTQIAVVDPRSSRSSRSSFGVVLHATPLGRVDLRHRRGAGGGVLRGHPRQADQVLALRPLGRAERLRRHPLDAPLRLGPLRRGHRAGAATSSRSCCSAASRSSAAAGRSSASCSPSRSSAACRRR